MKKIRENETNIMLKLLNKYLPNNGLIPFDMAKRKELYAKAFKDLAGYVDKQ